MPRRDKRKIERTGNPYAPFSFKPSKGGRRLLFVPRTQLFRGAKPFSRIMDLHYSKSKKLEIRRQK